MPPRIVLIRHAQAFHNVNHKSPTSLRLVDDVFDYTLHDPSLSDLGVEQCAALRENLRARFGAATKDVKDVAIIASPMRRTLQTTLHSLGWLHERGVKIEANADWQENSDKPCDTGSPIPSVAAEFPQADFSTVDPVYPDKMTPAGKRYAHTRTAIVERGRLCLDSLYQRPESLIFVVSHSAFMRCGVVGWWFFNSDYRIFDFDASGALREGRRVIVQDESTIKGGMGLSWDERVELGSELPEEDAVESSA